MPVEIVPVEEKHLESFWKCFDAVCRERRWMLRYEAPNYADTVSFLLDRIEQDHPYFVAVDDTQVVGWIDVTPLWMPVATHVARLGMGISKAYRGQGLGSRLLQTVLDKAREKGIKRIELEVFAHNEAAIKLYEKFRFQHEGRKVKYALLDDGYHDLLVMGLWIAEEA